MTRGTTRRRLLRYAAGATVTTGLFGTASAAGTDDADTLTRSGTVGTPDDTFDIPVGPSEPVDITFEATGEFPYYCIPHCGFEMVGTVVVEER